MLLHKSAFDTWLPALFDGQFHWDFLLPAWIGTRIEPMDVDAQFTIDGDGNVSDEAHDIDAKIERRSHRLIFETKMPGRKIDKGPRITLTEEWKIGATVLFLAGKTAEQIKGYAVYREGQYAGKSIPEKPELTPGDAFDVIYLCRKWFLWSQGLPCPNRNDWDNQLWTWDYERDKPWDEWCRDKILDERKRAAFKLKQEN